MLQRLLGLPPDASRAGARPRAACAGGCARGTAAQAGRRVGFTRGSCAPASCVCRAPAGPAVPAHGRVRQRALRPPAPVGALPCGQLRLMATCKPAPAALAPPPGLMRGSGQPRAPAWVGPACCSACCGRHLMQSAPAAVAPFRPGARAPRPRAPAAARSAHASNAGRRLCASVGPPAGAACAQAARGSVGEALPWCSAACELIATGKCSFNLRVRVRVHEEFWGFLMRSEICNPLLLHAY